MRVFTWGMASAIAVSMVATSAIAAQSTRSAVALPSATAPVSGVRAATPLKRTSSQSDGGSPVVGYVLAAIVGAGVIAATIEGTDNDSNYGPDSAG